MPHIILTEEQARVVTAASGAVEVHDPQGRQVASLTPLSSFEVEALARHKQRRGSGRAEPAIPAHQVQAHLQRLEEIRAAEGMDEAKMLDLLRRMRAGEVV